MSTSPPSHSPMVQGNPMGRPSVPTRWYIPLSIPYCNQYADLLECPKCHSERYISGSNIPMRRFTYLPLKPRLERIFGTANIAGVLQSHAHLPREGVVYDIQSMGSCIHCHWSISWRPSRNFFAQMESIHLHIIRSHILCGPLCSLC